MAIEIKAPTLPESVPDGTIATWYKKEGQQVARDELLVDIETDKVLLEVVAPFDGVLAKIHKAEGELVVSSELLAELEKGAAPAAAKEEAAAAPANAASKPASAQAQADEDQSDLEVLMSPAARKLVEENSLDANAVPSTGKDGRLTKEDVVNYLGNRASANAKSADADD